MTLSTLKTFRRATGLVVVTAMVCLAGAAVFHSSGTNRDLGSVSNVEPDRSSASRRRPPARATGSSPPTVECSPSATRSFFGSTGSLQLARADRRHRADAVGQGLLARRRPTAACSPSATRTSSARRVTAASPPPSSASPPRVRARATGSSRATAASSRFGDAPFLGSTGGRRLAAPVVGIARTRSGNGYWLVTSNGARLQLRRRALAEAGRQRRHRAGRRHLAPERRRRLLARRAPTAAPPRSARPVRSRPRSPTSSAGSDSDPVVTITSSPKGGYWVATAHGTVGVSTKQKAAPRIAKPAAKTTGWIAYQLFRR